MLLYMQYMQDYVTSLVALGTERFNSPLVKHPFSPERSKLDSRIVKHIRTLLMFGYFVGERVS